MTADQVEELDDLARLARLEYRAARAQAAADQADADLAGLRTGLEQRRAQVAHLEGVVMHAAVDAVDLREAATAAAAELAAARTAPPIPGRAVNAAAGTATGRGSVTT